jgi:hypothetical protein
VGEIEIEEPLAGAVLTCLAVFQREKAGSPMSSAASASRSIASRFGSCSTNAGSICQKRAKRMRVYVDEVREELSSATRRTPSMPSGWRMTRMMDRTRSREAMAQPGMTASVGVNARAETGTSPMSALPAASFAAHSAGVSEERR